MKNLLLIILLAFSSFKSFSNADITFCVDISCFNSITAPTVFGAFNGWNAGANPITDPDGDGTYCAIISMPDGLQEYLFFFQEEGPENMTPGDPCTTTNFGFTNRVINVVNGVPQMVTFGWENCTMACIPPPTATNIELCVDMSCFQAVQAPSVFGAFNGWNAGANPVTDPDGDGIYCATIGMMPGEQEYKFFDQIQGPENMLTPEDDACTKTTGPFTNRVITVVDGVPQSVVFGWETCDPSCGAAPVFTDITFCVDMSCFPSVTAPTIFGTFNGWNAGANPVTDPDGDGIYCATIGLATGEQEYKFFFQEQGPENMTIPEDAACTKTTGANTNRVITVVDQQPQTVTFGWGNCDLKCQLTAPLAPAPNPNCASSDVVSVYSNSYLSVPVSSWFGAGSVGLLSDIQIGGNDVKLYENLDIVYVEINAANLIDISAMNTLNVDFWTPDLDIVTFRIFDAGADGNLGGNDDAEMEYSCANVKLCTWNTFKIPISSFVNLTPSTGIVQLQIQGLPAGMGKLFLDNLYFSAEPCAPYTNDIPLTAAPTPTCAPANVISMFSDAYTDVPVDTWLTPWSSATGGTIVPIAGNDTRLYENVDFLGIETVTNQIDASGMSNFNIDVWTPNMTTFRVKLVNFGPGGNSEHEIAFTPTIAGWNTYNIPLADFIGLTGTSNIAQLILSGLPVGGGTVFIDNVYFSNCAPTAPGIAAPTPTCAPANVISMFSDAYTDVPVDTWLTPWSSATGGNIVPVAGNDTRFYENVNFLGIETVNNQIDASGMGFFNIDVWTPNMTTFRVKLVDFGPNGIFQGGDDSEFEIAFTPTLAGWNTYQIPMADFTGLTNTNNIAQLILSGIPVGGGTLYIDNVYFSNCLPSAPLSAAPTPTCAPANVISMFSDAYTDVPVDTWLTPWSSATGGTIVTIAGNDARLYENVDFLGIETVSNQIDASGMANFNIDVWTPNMTTFRVKLVDFGPNGVFQGGDDSEFEIVFTPTLSGWNTYQIPMADFTGLTNTNNIAQLILSGIPVGQGTLYIDNVYFSTCAGPLPTVPTVAAPLPTCAAANVISMFSDAYTDVPVDTWLTPWSSATGGNIVPIAGNDTRLYENVDFLGIETVTNQIDASGMTNFNIDVWTPNMTTFRVKLVNFGPGGNSEHEIAFTPTLSGWNTYKIPMADFIGLTGTSNIAQLILSGIPVGQGTLYIDNVYFSTCP